MYNSHPTDFLIFSFDREVSQSKVLFQCPRINHVIFFIGYHISGNGGFNLSFLGG